MKKQLPKCSAGCGRNGRIFVSGYGLVCDSAACAQAAMVALAEKDRAYNAERPIINAGLGATLGSYGRDDRP